MAAEGPPQVSSAAVPVPLAPGVSAAGRPTQPVQPGGRAPSLNPTFCCSPPSNAGLSQVDGVTVSERTVIARAIPPSGSLWLGCRPRDRPRGPGPAALELYLFRMWADLDQHGPCEDGSLVGWKARYWGLTSARARQRDPRLQCGERDAVLLPN